MKQQRMHAYLTPASKASLLTSVCAPALAAAMSLTTGSPALAACGLPLSTETKCVTAVTIPGVPLRSFDISWVSTTRNEYYLGDRSNAGIDVLDASGPTPSFLRTITGGVPGVCDTCKFVGVVAPGGSTAAVDNNHSGPDGVTSHGRWLYAGDGDSTLKVIDLQAPPPGTQNAIVQSISTGGTTRVDEMALTANGKLLIAANNAEDPPFATLFNANGDNASTNVHKVASIPNGRITMDPALVVPGFGQSIEQPTWEPKTARFYTSVPVVNNNPPGSGCNANSNLNPPQPITCDGGVLVVDPLHPKSVYGLFDPGTNTGVILLTGCSPNGITVQKNQNLLLGCTPANNPSNKVTQVINAVNHAVTNISGITGSDEVWYNWGDSRTYTGSSNNNIPSPGHPVLGVIDVTNVLIETLPQSSGSHSVAASSTTNLIFVPQVAPRSVVGVGGDTTTNGAAICGGTSGCIAVYRSGAF
jgi:hypothetical protein